MSRPPVVALVGPTASGKTALALELSRALPLEIVSCDSQAIYRGLDLGTAKPSRDERARVPHHLVDVVDPWESFSARAYVAAADAAIEAIAARGRLPLLVGGTGLYLRALLRGLFEGPGADPALREALEERAAREGLAALHAELRAVDPASAARIQVGDPIRIIRALEVHALTGQPISWHHARDAERPPRYDALVLGLTPPRDALFSRVERRARAMFDEGLVEETARLAADARSRPRLERIMGYREALAVIEGRLSRPEAIEQTRLAQRRYAKRQLTWFRAEPELHWLSWPPDAAQALDEIARFRAAACAGRDP